MYGYPHETTCCALDMFSDDPSSMRLYPEADDTAPKAGAWNPARRDMASLGYG